ncbi:hypothetical protein GCM10027190_51140 [Spirosoma areae]
MTKEASSTVGSTVNSENVIYLVKSSNDILVPASGNTAAYLKQTHRIVAIDPNTGNELAIFPNDDKGFYPFPLFFTNGSLLVGGYYPDDQSKRKVELVDATNAKLKVAFDSQVQVDIFSVIDNGNLYRSNVANTSSFVANDLNTAKEKWRIAEYGNRPVVSNGLLYYINPLLQDKRGIFCYDAASSEKKWSIQGPENGSVGDVNPVVTDGSVYYVRSPKTGGNANVIAAIDAKTGKLLWEYPVENAASIKSSMTVADGVLYGSAKNDVFAIDAKTGAKKWNKTLTETLTNDVNTGVTVGNGLVFLVSTGSSTNKVIALDANTGDTKWTSNQTADSFRAIIYANGVLYTGKAAIDASTGGIKWQLKDNSGPFGSTDPTKYYSYYAAGFVLVVKNKTYYPTYSGMQQ